MPVEDPRYFERVTLLTVALNGSQAETLVEGLSVPTGERARELIQEVFMMSSQGRQERLTAAFLPPLNPDGPARAVLRELPARLLSEVARWAPAHVLPHVRTESGDRASPRLVSWAKRLARESVA